MRSCRDSMHSMRSVTLLNRRIANGGVKWNAKIIKILKKEDHVRLIIQRYHK